MILDLTAFLFTLSWYARVRPHESSIEKHAPDWLLIVLDRLNDVPFWRLVGLVVLVGDEVARSQPDEALAIIRHLDVLLLQLLFLLLLVLHLVRRHVHVDEEVRDLPNVLGQLHVQLPHLLILEAQAGICRVSLRSLLLSGPPVEEGLHGHVS